ncbi:MAG: hypothetical protein KAT49_00795 [Methanomicrobia archaeon]|nr:hypothetical protein [Methanomicrobia archaeon]
MKLHPYLSVVGILFVSLGIVTTVVGRHMDSATTSKTGIGEIAFGLLVLILYFVDRGDI